MLVVLRMNRDFMMFMRENYFAKSRRFSLSISLLFAQATTSRLLRLLQLNDGRHNLQFQASCCSAFLIEACYLMLALVRESIVYCEIMCMKPEPLCPSKFSPSLILILNQRTSHCTLHLGPWALNANHNHTITIEGLTFTESAAIFSV